MIKGLCELDEELYKLAETVIQRTNIKDNVSDVLMVVRSKLNSSLPEQEEQPSASSHQVLPGRCED